MIRRLSPDGARYMAMANGQAVPNPFMLRWLLPKVLGISMTTWTWATHISLGVILAETAALAYLEVGTPLAAVVAVLCVAQCPGVFDISEHLPVLVDVPAMAFALGAALALQWDHPAGIAVAVGLSLLAGMTKETAPLFGALFALSPIPLVGLVAPALRFLFVEPGNDVKDIGVSAKEAVRFPWRTSKSFRRGSLRSFDAWGGPWGVALVGFAWPPAWPAIIAAYAQCLVATDRVRLYQWAAPVVGVGAATVATDWRWLPVIAALALWRPWPSEGI